MVVCRCDEQTGCKLLMKDSLGAGGLLSDRSALSSADREISHLISGNLMHADHGENPIQRRYPEKALDRTSTLQCTHKLQAMAENETANSSQADANTASIRSISSALIQTECDSRMPIQSRLINVIALEGLAVAVAGLAAALRRTKRQTTRYHALSSRTKSSPAL